MNVRGRIVRDVAQKLIRSRNLRRRHAKTTAEGLGAIANPDRLQSRAELRAHGDLVRLAPFGPVWLVDLGYAGRGTSSVGGDFLHDPRNEERDGSAVWRDK